jgi:phosphoglycerol transferase MdoB-like AlkP superfamily enzyme
LSGIPSQAITSILKFDSKQRQLPAIAQVLANEGYHTSFYYGGESEFVNTKSYLLNHAYSRIIDKNSFAKKDMNSKWGAFDEVVLRCQLEDMNKERQPFFSTILTLTNHEPFELPTTARYGRASLPQMFKSTAYYTDSCIGDYMRKAAQQPWFNNTLFILVADHGHLLPENKYDINNYHRFRIPLLFYGGAIAPEWRGKVVDKIGSQTDIAATLLRQMHLNTDSFTWSKDLFNPASKDFAFYDWDNGFGFASPLQIVSFDNIGKTITFRKNDVPKAIDDSMLMFGKAYMQSVYNRFFQY